MLIVSVEKVFDFLSDVFIVPDLEMDWLFGIQLNYLASQMEFNYLEHRGYLEHII